MSEIKLQALGCECKNWCAHFVEPMENCVDYISRTKVVATAKCEKCEAATWHIWENNKPVICMRCQRLGEDDA